MKPDTDSTTVTLLAVRVLAQLGCFLVLIIGGAVVVGLLADQLLGTKPAIMFLLLLGSIPATMWIIYRYTLQQTKHLKNLPSQKEDDIT